MMQDKQLLDDFHTLPPDEQAEVIDFIQRLKAKREMDGIQGQASVSLENDSQIDLQEVKQKRLTFGCMKGLVTYMADDFDAPLEDFADYM